MSRALVSRALFAIKIAVAIRALHVPILRSGWTENKEILYDLTRD